MTRVVAILATILVLLVAVVTTTTAGGDDGGAVSFQVQLDNTFGLTKGADVRVAGVRVGSIASLDLEVRTARAIAGVQIERPEFGGLRRDAFCTVSPQSLIGEYFLDCDPGVAARRLPEGGTVPVSRTAGTVPPDLVLDTLRRPYRERLGILLAELGAGFAARGGDVNETIARAIPALRQTDRVLVQLSRERKTLAALARDGARTLGALSAGRDDVARFVAQARETASVTADRRTELAGTIRRLPAFQRALRPVLADLGTAARAQTPALNQLRLAAPPLTGALNRLGPFAEAARPFVRSLGRASETGRRAVITARPTVRQLRAVGTRIKEPATNLRFVLEHLNDRGNAAEPNPESPGGKGFTGLEALLQYPFTQSQAINLFDDRGYLLKIALLVNECTPYTNAATALRTPARTKRCSAALGSGGRLEPIARDASRSRKAKRSAPKPGEDGTPALVPDPSAGAVAPPEPATPAPAPPRSPELKLPGLPPIKLPQGVPPVDLTTRDRADATKSLLDFLLGP